MTLFLTKIDSQIKTFNLLECNINPDHFILTKMIKTGLPIGLDSLSNFGSFFLMGIMMGWLGKNNLIAEQIVNQYSGLFMAPIMATAIATDVLVGYDIANANARNIKRLSYSALMVGAVFGCLNLIIVSSAPKALASPFLDESDHSFNDILAIVKPLFIIVSLLNIGEMIRNISSGGLRGFYDTTIPVVATILIFWAIGMPLSYVLDSLLNLGANGIFLGRTVGSFCAGGLILHRWMQKSDNPEQSIQEGEAGLLTKFSGIFSKCCKTNSEPDLNLEEELSIRSRPE